MGGGRQKEADEELAALQEENKRLWAGCEAKASGSPAVSKRTVGVQELPVVERCLPLTRKSVEVQTFREEGVGGKSLDRIAAFIDAKIGALRENLLAEITGGAGAEAPARREKRLPPPAPAAAVPSLDGEP